MPSHKGRGSQTLPLCLSLVISVAQGEGGGIAGVTGGDSWASSGLSCAWYQLLITLLEPHCLQIWAPVINSKITRVSFNTLRHRHDRLRGKAGGSRMCAVPSMEATGKQGWKLRKKRQKSEGQSNPSERGPQTSSRGRFLSFLRTLRLAGTTWQVPGHRDLESGHR